MKTTDKTSINYFRPDDLTQIRKLFPKAQLVYIEGAGHNVHHEQPNAFFDSVVQFLSYNAKNKAQI